MRLRALVFALTCLIAPSLTGCASNPPPTTKPTQTIAYYGWKALRGVSIVQKLVADLEAAPAGPLKLDEKIAAQYMIHAHKAGEIGEQLATALEVYETLTSPTDQATKFDQIQAVIVLFEAELAKMLKLDTSAAALEIAKLVTNIQTTLTGLKVELAKYKTTPPPAARLFTQLPLAA